MFETVTPRLPSLFDQIDTVQRLLSRQAGLTGAPGAIRSVAYGSFPDINVARTPTTVEVFAFAPGVDLASFEVTIERNVLKIAGTRPSQLPSGEGRVQVYANERAEGHFSRAVSLPDDVDPLAVEARYRDGVLRISVGLNAAAQPQQITVQ